MKPPPTDPMPGGKVPSPRGGLSDGTGCRAPGRAVRVCALCLPGRVADGATLQVRGRSSTDLASCHRETTGFRRCPQLSLSGRGHDRVADYRIGLVARRSFLARDPTPGGAVATLSRRQSTAIARSSRRSSTGGASPPLGARLSLCAPRPAGPREAAPATSRSGPCEDALYPLFIWDAERQGDPPVRYSCCLVAAASFSSR